MKINWSKLENIGGQLSALLISVFMLSGFWFVLYASMVAMLLGASKPAAYTVKGYAILSVILALPLFFGSIAYISFKEMRNERRLSNGSWCEWSKQPLVSFEQPAQRIFKSIYR